MLGVSEPSLTREAGQTSLKLTSAIFMTTLYIRCLYVEISCAPGPMLDGARKMETSKKDAQAQQLIG
jgi:hypothetical protein